jgi:hypothetical protein
MPSDLDLLGAQRAVFLSALSAEQKLLALALLGHWSKTRETFPGLARLAAWTSCSRRTVIRSLLALESAGHIGVARERGRPNHYDLSPLMSLPVSEGHQCQPVTSAHESPVPGSHPTSATGALPPVPGGHPTSASLTPDLIQEGNQGRKPRKRASGAARQTRTPPAHKAPVDFVFNDADREAEQKARGRGVNVEGTRATWLAFEYERPIKDFHAAWRNWLAREKAGNVARRGQRPVQATTPELDGLGMAKAQALLGENVVPLPMAGGSK